MPIAHFVAVSRRATLTVCIALVGAGAVPVLGAQGSVKHAQAVAPCSPRVRDGLLPVWMRGGFGSGTRITYAIGVRKAIGAVLWNKPLNAPPAQDMNNKILWVPRHVSKSVAPMWIKMQQMDGARLVGAPVRRIVTTGPGPSIIDAPSAGCWRFTLTWSGRRDTLDLAYVPPTG
jgi:hypothetical protein